jgi:cytochrome P450
MDIRPAHAAAPPGGSLGALFNPFAPDQLEDPFPLYAQARREEPVFYSPHLDTWVITRYADLCAVTRDPVSFSSVGALEAKPNLPAEVSAILSTGHLEFLSLVQSDPPDHTRIRNVFNKALSSQRVAALEPKIRELAGALLDAFVEDGHADFVTQFAFPLAGCVISDLLGVPRSDIKQIKQWSNDKQVLLAASGPVERLVESAHGFVALQRYFHEHLASRGRAPRDDLLTLLVPAELGGAAPLSVQEAVCNAIDLLAAGHETTADLLGNGLSLLMANPDQMAALRADRSLLTNAIEEMLRMEAPVRGLFRTATTTVELGGVTLPKGARLFALYAAGNRDEAQFPDADRFDIRRQDASTHLSFSKGIHYCVGNILARLEGRIGFELVLERLPNVRRDAKRPSERRPYLILRGYEHLPVEWDVQ